MTALSLAALPLAFLPLGTLGLAALGLATGCSTSAPLPERTDREPPVEVARVRDAIERTVPLLQQSMETWIQEASCISCHHQGLGTMALTMARERGFDLDERLFDRQLERMLEEAPGGAFHGDAGVNGTFGRSFQLVALGAAGQPPDDRTAALAHYLKGNGVAVAEDETTWLSTSYRPPLEATPVTGTAFAIRALDLYRADARAEEADATIARGVRWLRGREARDSEERNMRLLGLRWGGADHALLREAVGEVLAAQRPDGGWAQLSTMESDVYATGQALTVLHQAGGVSSEGDAFRRGIRFLLDAQLEDGSWLVETRRRAPGLPYFETGFPHRMHQFISTAATAWATMALACALDPAPSAAFHGERPPPAPSPFDLGLAEVHRAAAFGTLEELRAALDAGGDPNAIAPGGLRPLHLAIHDPERTALLVERGAELEARTDHGTTALTLAAWYGGSAAAELLLDLGAEPNPGQQANGWSPLIRAVQAGKHALVRRLHEAGASLDSPGADGLTPLHWAAAGGDVATAALLLDLGAAVDPRCDESTPLQWASFDGEAEVVELLLARGADPDAVDDQGRTALALAARVEHGNRRTLDALLRAGADPTIAPPDGRTPLEWARYFENELAVEALE